MKRTKLLALLGAAVLTVGTVGIALATELKTAHQGIVVGWDENGDPYAEDANGDPFPVNPEECLEEDVADGDVLFHFVETNTVANSEEDMSQNLLDVDFADPDADQTGVWSDTVQGNGSNVDWFVLATPVGDSIELISAESNLTGDEQTELKVSHICVGGEGGEEETSEPSFSGGEQELTEPPTDTFGGNGTSTPADSAWLLVVALGVLLASVVVLTPARAKSRR